MTEQPERVIEAICDDPRHARGKVAKIAAFGRFTRNGQTRWRIRGKDGDWRYTRPDPAGVFRRYGAPDEDKGSTYVWECKLCGRSLDVRESTLHQVLEGTYQGLLNASEGARVSPVSLALLRRVASQVDRLH